MIYKWQRGLSQRHSPPLWKLYIPAIGKFRPALRPMGDPCTSAPVSRISSGNPGQAGVDHMTNEMTMTNAVIECILRRSAAKYYDTAATLSDAKIRELVRVGRFQRSARASGVGGGSGHHAGKYGVGLGNPRARPVHGAPAAPARRGSTYLWRRR